MGWAIFICLWILMLYCGMAIVILLRIGDDMDNFNAAVTRLQASVDKIIAKVDTLASGNDATLSLAADQINAVSDKLDAKNS